MRVAFVCSCVIAIALAVSSAAWAADMPVKAPPNLSAVPAPYSWSGCYVGAHAGVAWAKTKWTNTADTSLFGDLVPGDSLSKSGSGLVGGGQVGCNYQINAFVFGLEGTLAASTIDDSVTNTTFGAADDIFTTRINGIATVVGRIGYAWNNWLIYAKGGYAGANVKLGVSDTVAPNKGSGSATNWHSGWTVGGGIELGLSPHWIVGIDYSYMDLQTINDNVAGGSDGVYRFDVRPRIQQAVVRLSYKF